MKKIICLSIIFVILLCGCSGRKSPELTVYGISFTADIVTDEHRYKLNSEIDGNGNFTATVIYPETIKGMYITLEQNNLLIQYLGVSYNKETGKFPAESVIKLLYDTMSDVYENGTANGDSIIKGSVDGKNYKLTFSNKGLPLTLEIPSLNTVINFSNVIIKDR